MRLEASTIDILEFLIILRPLVLHFPLKVLTDLEVSSISLEGLLN